MLILKRVAVSIGLLLAAGAGASAQSLVERGGYLVNGIGVCGNCHSPRGGDPRALSGGTNTFNTPAYTVKGPNLTPDPDTGLGKWSDDDIKRALVKASDRMVRSSRPTCHTPFTAYSRRAT